MSKDSSFIAMGLGLVEHALLDVIARDNLHLRPVHMPRTRRARANGRLKLIEQIVRRLIAMMALGLHVVFAPPKQRAPSPDLPDGVEIVVFPGAVEYHLTLRPASQQLNLSDPFPEIARNGCARAGLVSTARLLARVRALHRLLKSPETAAKRLARSFQRLKAKGRPSPVAGPAPNAFRLNAELGALSTALPGLLNARLMSAWTDSG